MNAHKAGPSGSEGLRLLNEIAEINGSPIRWLATDKEIEDKRKGYM